MSVKVIERGMSVHERRHLLYVNRDHAVSKARDFFVPRYARVTDIGVTGRLKTGHEWALQNRPH